MDLVTLVAACALTVDPKLVHALIWHQSGGEPWAFSVPGERQPQVYPSAQEAIREARFAEGVPIRVGLTGLATDSRTATLAMFMPCANISIAARQITQLHERKTVPPPGTDPVHCAVAAYRGFWEHPDKKFADAVLRSVVKADAPNFDMQNATYGGSSDIPPQALGTLQRRRQLRLTINSEAGRVLCFPQGHSSSAVFPQAKVRTIQMQIGCKKPTIHDRTIQ